MHLTQSLALRDGEGDQVSHDSASVSIREPTVRCVTVGGWLELDLICVSVRGLNTVQSAQLGVRVVRRMQSPAETVLPSLLMVELIGLLGDFPPDQNRRRAEVLGIRLADLEHRARSQEATPETVAAIRGARVLLDLAELPPLPPSGTNT
ncbi:hypothetical protein MKK69_01225 [Methylobacterium sp. J-026]|uniref:hypothetical protein n=1 Tax=Methylobacterium sp. J-026 TaxID=2836624 RepID=UPI001FB993DB|nr:hypothetical protein [Methylobacterium sp. J-026]MCJ2132700.1 hypothetical protein [Methylobacterium sp. J-026]